MNLKIMLFQEWPVPIQIFLEIGVVVLIGLIQGIGNFRIPGFHMPAVTVVILIGSHISLKAAVTIFFAAINFIGRYKPIVGNISFQNMVIAKHQRSRSVHGIQMKIGIDRRHPKPAHPIDAHLVIHINDKTFQNKKPLPILGKKHVMVGGAGNGGNFFGIADLIYHLGKAKPFRMENRKPIP